MDKIPAGKRKSRKSAKKLDADNAIAEMTEKSQFMLRNAIDGLTRAREKCKVEEMKFKTQGQVGDTKETSKTKEEELKWRKVLNTAYKCDELWKELKRDIATSSVESVESTTSDNPIPLPLDQNGNIVREKSVKESLFQDFRQEQNDDSIHSLSDEQSSSQYETENEVDGQLDDHDDQNSLLSLAGQFGSLNVDDLRCNTSFENIELESTVIINDYLEFESSDESPQNSQTIPKRHFDENDNTIAIDNDESENTAISECHITKKRRVKKDNAGIFDLSTEESEIDEIVARETFADFDRGSCRNNLKLSDLPESNLSTVTDIEAEMTLKYSQQLEFLSPNMSSRVSNISRDEANEIMPKERPDADSLDEQPDFLNVTLMRHQLHALKFMRWRESQSLKGGILADDMGLGKTLTTIALILKQQQKNIARNIDARQSSWISKGRTITGGTLIVCPASLIGQWEAEIKEMVMFGQLKCHVFHGFDKAKSAMSLSQYDVVITTYHAIVYQWHDEIKNRGILYKLKFQRIVLDEGENATKYEYE